MCLNCSPIATTKECLCYHELNMCKYFKIRKSYIDLLMILQIFFIKLNEHAITAYRKTGSRDPSGILAGPYKNWKTRTLAGPYKNQKTGILVGPYKNWETGTLVGPYRNWKTRTRELSGTLKKPGIITAFLLR